MGVLDTTYTFTATDVVTSAKLNNVIDQTTFTSSAVATGNVTLAVTESGQLKVNTSGIAANELASLSVTQAKLAANVVGNGPFVFAYALSGESTTVPTGNGSFTKISLPTEGNDTNNNFLNSRFTPTVAGFYQVNAQLNCNNGANSLTALIFKGTSNSLFAAYAGSANSAQTYISTVSGIVFCDGSADYIEIHAQHVNGANALIYGNISACLIRSA